jgi:hypothetical protein
MSDQTRYDVNFVSSHVHSISKGRKSRKDSIILHTSYYLLCSFFYLLALQIVSVKKHTIMRQPTCLSMQGLACLALSFTSVSAYLPMIRQAAFRRVQMQWSGNQLPITSSDPVSSCRVTFPATVLFSTEQEVNVVTNELDTLQTLFSKYCDGDGLMSKSAALAIPSIADLLVRSSTQALVSTIINMSRR